MKILMITPYAPARDGIATYAVQMVAQLQGEGHDVTVLSPGPSAAQMHLNLSDPRAGLALLKRIRPFDKVIVQYHPAFFYENADPRTRNKSDLGYTAAYRLAKEVEVWVHEIEYAEFERDKRRRQVQRLMWESVDRLCFHSDIERDRFVETLGVSKSKTFVEDHGAHFKVNTRFSREEARASLGIDPDAFAFLAIGFIQQHKGFDRAVRAFAGLDAHGGQINVVGSIRVDEPEFVAYLGSLQALVDRTPGASLHTGYLSDEMFDRWIVASDVVVLPYREIWSSGVMERAHLLERPVIATRVGGLEHQAADEDVTLVKSDEELRQALWNARGVEAPPASLHLDLEGEGDLFDRVQRHVQDEARLLRGGDYIGEISDAVEAVPVCNRPGLPS